MVYSWFQVFIYLATGILLARYQFWYIALPIVILLLLNTILKRRYYRDTFIAGIVLLCGFLYFDFVLIPDPGQLPSYEDIDVIGKVKTYPRYDGTRCKFILHVENSNSYQKRLQVYCNFPTELRKGDKVKIHGSLRPPNLPGNPGELNYKAYLAYSHIHYILSVKEDKDLEIVSRQRGMQGWISSYNLQGEKIIRDFLPPEEANILLGMLLGKKEGIDPGQYKDFQKTGIVHVFAVSGLHVGFILLLTGGLTSLLNLSRRLKFYSGIIVLLIYGSMVGWPVSVVRAAIMASTGLFAYYMGRDNRLLNSLGIAGIIILLLDPYALFKISFQLSFLAAWGLVYLYPLLKERTGMQNRFWDLVLIPLSAQVAILPLIAYHFNLFTPIAIISNILVSYLAGGTVMLGFLSLLVAGVLPFLSTLFLYPAGLFIEIIIALTELLKSLPAGYLWVATPHVLLVLIYYAGLILTVISLNNYIGKPWMVTGISLTIIFMIIICLPAGIYNRGTMEIVFIDVGQGDSILFKTAGGKFLLIDGGGSDFFDAGERKVLPYLHHRGIRELFMVINTHPDTDHLQGLEKVAEEMPVRYIGLPASTFSADKYEHLRQIGYDKKIPLIPLEQGMELNIEQDMQVRIMYPGGKEYPGDDYNNQSLVIRSQFGKFSLLLTGDIENEILHKLLQERKLEPTTVVKVPHHGSKGAMMPEFYEKISPVYAVISAGKNNPFGHPHQSVLDILTEQQIKILRTDIQGAIMMESDGNILKIRTNN